MTWMHFPETDDGHPSLIINLDDVVAVRGRDILLRGGQEIFSSAHAIDVVGGALIEKHQINNGGG